MDDNLHTLGDELERWTLAFQDRDGDFTVKVSSKGRMMVSSDDMKYVLPTVAAMHCLQGILREYIEHGFGPTPEEDPPGGNVVRLRSK